MKTIMTRMLAVLVMLAMLLSAVPALGDADDKITLSFAKGQSLVLFDQDGVKVTLTGEVVDDGFAYMELKAIIENSSATSVSVRCGGIVNGWSFNENGMGNGKTVVPAGAKGKSCIYLPYEDLDLKSFKDIEYMDATFYVEDAAQSDFINHVDLYSVNVYLDFGGKTGTYGTVTGSDEAAPEEETAEQIGKGDKIKLDFVEMKLEEVGSKKEYKFVGKTTGGTKITSGPATQSDSTVVYALFTLTNTAKKKYGVQIDGELLIGGYSYEVKEFVCKKDATPGNVVEPLNEVNCLVYALVPDSIVKANSEWTMYFSFDEGFECSHFFDYKEADYLYMVSTAAPAKQTQTQQTKTETQQGGAQPEEEEFDELDFDRMTREQALNFIEKHHVGELEIDYDLEDIKAIQTMLNDLGYDCGTADGVAGQKTEQALIDFQNVMGINATGTANVLTFACLYYEYMGLYGWGDDDYSGDDGDFEFDERTQSIILEYGFSLPETQEEYDEIMDFLKAAGMI